MGWHIHQMDVKTAFLNRLLEMLSLMAKVKIGVAPKLSIRQKRQRGSRGSRRNRGIEEEAIEELETEQWS